jgi:hypothetical protein
VRVIWSRLLPRLTLHLKATIFERNREVAVRDRKHGITRITARAASVMQASRFSFRRLGSGCSWNGTCAYSAQWQAFVLMRELAAIGQVPYVWQFGGLGHAAGGIARYQAGLAG